MISLCSTFQTNASKFDTNELVLIRCTVDSWIWYVAGFQFKWWLWPADVQCASARVRFVLSLM